MAEPVDTLLAELALVRGKLAKKQAALTELRSEVAALQRSEIGLVEVLRARGVDTGGIPDPAQRKRPRRRKHVRSLSDLAADALAGGAMTIEVLAEAVSRDRGKETTPASLNSALHRERPDRFDKDSKTKQWRLVGNGAEK